MSEVVLSIKTKETLEKWSKKLNVDFKTVNDIFTKFLSEEKDEKKARLKTIGTLQEEYGSLISNAQWFYVYLLDDSGVIDIFDLMRQKSINMFNDPNRQQEALDKGMVTIDGTPLDYREKVYGKINENKGLPLTGHLYSRTFFGIVSNVENFDSPFIGEMTANGEYAQNLNTIGTFKFFKFRGNQNRKNPNRINLGPATKFIEIGTKITPREIADKVFTVPMDQVEQNYKDNFAGKKNVSYVCPIRGSVTYLSLQPIQNHRIAVLSDEDSASNIRCRFHESIPINFQAYDELLTFNKLYSDRQGRIGANVKAYMLL